MIARPCNRLRAERGVGLMEVMISIVIGMLLVLVIYQVYEISESQKRTITAGSDAQQNASYGLFVLGRDLSHGRQRHRVDGGKPLSLRDAAADSRPDRRPAPTTTTPDTVTVLYGGSSSLSTAVPFRNSATGPQNYVVPGPVGFSADADATKTDMVAAVQGATCTISRINVVAVDPATGFATISHTPVAGAMNAPYTSGSAVLVNLGPTGSMGRIQYTVDTTSKVLRTQNLLPDPLAAAPPNPVINDVVNLKAQYGVDANCDGVLTWVPPTGTWSAANVQALPLPTTSPPCVPGTPSLRQIHAVRISIVTRSSAIREGRRYPAVSSRNARPRENSECSVTSP